jgi:hypothetical protein
MRPTTFPRNSYLNFIKSSEVPDIVWMFLGLWLVGVCQRLEEEADATRAIADAMREIADAT